MLFQSKIILDNTRREKIYASSNVRSLAAESTKEKIKA